MDKQKRDKLYQDIYNAAHTAAIKASTEIVPTPMIVGSPTTPFGNTIDPNKKTYFVADGVCGFGWVKLRRANHSFCKWIVDNNHGRKSSYEGGVIVNSPLRTQSMTRNAEYAHTFAKVINTIMYPDVEAMACSRID